MNDSVIAVIRTVIPAVAGLIIAGLANIGIDVDQTALVAVLNGVVIGLYYIVVRWLEKRIPWMGWLLGYPKPPTYA